MTKSTFATSPQPSAPHTASTTGAASPSAWLDTPHERTVYDDLGIRIDRDGIWYYHGSPIRRKELLCLFASSLQRDAEGRYWLITPHEMGPIEVEDAPFIAVELFVGGQGCKQMLSFRTNVDEIITVDEQHPLWVVIDPVTHEPSPYVALPGRREARLTRAIFYELVALGEEREDSGRTHLGVWSSGQFFSLGSVDG